MNLDQFLDRYRSHLGQVIWRNDLPALIGSARAGLEELRDAGGKVVFAGNGASATIASHFALDFTKQGGIPSMAFNDPALLTAYGNDYGYEAWVARAIEHYGKPGDIAVLISSSGKSPNVVLGARKCREMGIRVFSFTGFAADNPLAALGDLNFWVDSRAYNVIEGVHGIWLGVLCDTLIGEMEYGVSG